LTQLTPSNSGTKYFVTRTGFNLATIPDWRRIEVALDGILPELANAFESHSAASGAGLVRHTDDASLVLPKHDLIASGALLRALKTQRLLTSPRIWVQGLSSYESEIENKRSARVWRMGRMDSPGARSFLCSRTKDST
jgi:hypothetical protein